MSPDFSSHIMFCLSTGNQTVNLVPVLQFGIKRVKIFSTDFAETKGLTGRLQKAMKKRGIQVDPPVLIAPHDEKNVATLVKRLIVEALPHQKIVWNISGGQKIPSIALHTAFHNRSQAGFREDLILYLEASPPDTWWFGSDNKMNSTRSSCDISLDEVLILNDSVSDDKITIHPEIEAKHKDLLQIADKALDYYLQDDLFREAFFACMKPGFQAPASRQELTDVIRKSLNSVKPDLASISYDINEYTDLIGRIQALSIAIGNVAKPQKIQEALKRLSLIQKPEEVYKSYWSEIRKRAADIALKELDTDRVRLHMNPLTKNSYATLKEQIESLGGEVRESVSSIFYRDSVKFSGIGKNSALFEWMVAAAVIRSLNANQKLKESVAEIHLQCMTKSASNTSAKHDAELDLVITTRFGTLIILEVKTYDFSGDTAKGKDHSAYKKSGPYGKAVMVGPLIRSIITKDTSGKDQYPHYIDGKIQDQQSTALQNGIRYSYLDGIQNLLEKEMAITSALIKE